MKTFLIWILCFLLFLYSLIVFDGFHNWDISDNWGMVYWIIYWNKVGLNWEPSSRLEARLDWGYKLYEKEIISKIIVSWWVGVEWFDEAEVMKRYLLNKWIKNNDVIIDNDGYTTSQTSKNAYSLLGDSITVVWVSQWYHVSRVKLSLKKSWFSSVHWYAPKYFELRDIYSIFREWPAYLKYLFLK